MIRTTNEAPMFSLWREPALLDALVHVDFLTTARYEPVLRNGLGSGHVDLLFEDRERSCVVAGIRLDPNSLVTRERSAFVWPLAYAQALPAERLRAIEASALPWLRSLARARPMASEAIRRFTRSERFDRARGAELLGAAPLRAVMRRMAPFVYARRFATGANVWIDCADGALGQAVLADVAASIVLAHVAAADMRSDDRVFARSWYGIGPLESAFERSDILIADEPGRTNAPIVIRTSAARESTGVQIVVPSPAPLDLLFSFDAADAPEMARFGMTATEPPLRSIPGSDKPRAVGGSAGAIIIAMSAVARAMRGVDVDEVAVLAECLMAEGLTVQVITDVEDTRLAGAQLVHIVGGIAEAHTIAFAQAARRRGIDFLFDLAPRPHSPSGYVENMLAVAVRAASDDAERARYLQAYEERRVSGSTVPEPSAEDYARFETLFTELAKYAVAVLAAPEELDDLRLLFPEVSAERIMPRGTFVAPEPPPARIGHLVPHGSFALVHAAICARSHALYVALCAERAGWPLVIAGPCYDVEYLQTLRTTAPNAVVIADPEVATVSALYRRATLWVDAAPRPRSAAGLVRAVVCGALPVLAAESPLARIAGPDAPTFVLTSIAQCAETLVSVITSTDRAERMASLHERLAQRSRLDLTFAGLLSAYARIATVV